eukprot:s860_g12.t1
MGFSTLMLLMLFEIREVKHPTTGPAAFAQRKHAHFHILAAKILDARKVSSSFPCGKVKLNLSSAQPRNRNCHCCHCVTDVVPTCTDDFGVERSFC